MSYYLYIMKVPSEKYSMNVSMPSKTPIVREYTRGKSLECISL